MLDKKPHVDAYHLQVFYSSLYLKRSSNLNTGCLQKHWEKCLNGGFFVHIFWQCWLPIQSFTKSLTPWFTNTSLDCFNPNDAWCLAFSLDPRSPSSASLFSASGPLHCDSMTTPASLHPSGVCRLALLQSGHVCRSDLCMQEHACYYIFEKVEPINLLVLTTMLRFWEWCFKRLAPVHLLLQSSLDGQSISLICNMKGAVSIRRTSVHR